MVSSNLPKAAISWSSGKDSTMALYKTLMSHEIQPVTLLTTVNVDYERVSMHGVREELLFKQAEMCGLPLLKVEIPKVSSNQIYENAMRGAINKLKEMDVKYVVFGDIFLEDVRDYRIAMMKGTGIEPVFPLWGQNPHQLANEIINAGIKAKIVCLDPRKLDESFGGRDFNGGFLKDLPKEVDPCGENGEFHTFAYSAPFFSESIKIRVGQSAFRDGFYFTDLTPV